MRFPLYGNELNDETTPLEAGLGWITKLDKSDFIGRDALAKQKESGVPRALIGLTLLDRGIPRGGYKIFTGDGTEEVGTLTSGTQSPSLKKSIALGYVRPEFSAVGTRLSIEIRGVKIAAEVIPTPFYKRPY